MAPAVNAKAMIMLLLVHCLYSFLLSVGFLILSLVFAIYMYFCVLSSSSLTFISLKKERERANRFVYYTFVLMYVHLRGLD